MAKDAKFLHADNEDSDHTAWMSEGKFFFSHCHSNEFCLTICQPVMPTFNKILVGYLPFQVQVTTCKIIQKMINIYHRHLIATFYTCGHKSVQTLTKSLSVVNNYLHIKFE